MPAGLPSAPWLQPPQTAQHYTQGYGLGLQAASDQARIQQQQAALAQQAQQTQMEMEQRSKEKERQFLMEQQQMEIGKQYHQMQMGLAQQKLEEAKSMNAERIKAAAAKLQAQQQQQMDYKEFKDAGDDDRTALMKSYLKNAGGLGYTGQGIESLNKGMAPDQAPMPRVDPTSGALVDARGVPHWKPGSSASTPEKALDMDEYKKLQAANIRLKTTLAETKDKGIAESLQSEITNNVRRQRQLQQSLGMIPPTTQTGTASPATAPSAEGGAPTIVGHGVMENGRLVYKPATKGKVTIGGQSSSGEPSFQEQPSGSAPVGLSIGGMPIGSAPSSPPQATIPASVQPSAPSEWGMKAQDVTYTPPAIPQNNDAEFLAKIGHFLSGQDEEGKTMAEREAEERERIREQEEENQ